MLIKTDVKLTYYHNDGFHYTGNEGVYAIVKFREEGKWFKTKLKFWLIQAMDYKHRASYLIRLENLSLCPKAVEEIVKNNIKEYFIDKAKKSNNDEMLDKILSNFKAEFTISVEVDNKTKRGL